MAPTPSGHPGFEGDRALLPDVLNRRDFPGRLPRNTILIDRTTRWGNPFHIGQDGDRAEVIARYELWLPSQPALIAALPSLKGHNLMCWCAPKACHGHVLMRLAAKC